MGETRSSLAVVAACFAASLALAAGQPAPPQPLFPLLPPIEATGAAALDVVLLGERPVTRPLEQGELDWFVPPPGGGTPYFVVRGRQVGLRIDEPVFVTPATTLSWWWKKEKGRVCIVQIGLRGDATGQSRYLGYGAGEWSEPPSGDPTVEIFIRSEPPREWRREERRLLDDIRQVLGWESARITSFFISPWDGEPGWFREAAILAASPVDALALDRDREMRVLSSAGRGGPGRSLPLKGAGEKRVENFETAFEECAPGRNAGANEWSAFGAIGDRDFNGMGREMWVRYPAFDIAFRLSGGGSGAGREISPGDFPSFRLGLAGDCFPGIWGGWEHEGLLYKVTAFTVPSGDCGNFDLYRLDVQNLGDRPLPSQLVAAVEGPPDLRIEGPAVRGLGSHPFVVADPPAGATRILRERGLCDKRAKAYATGGGPGPTEPAIATYRLGLDGVPVAYRFKPPAAPAAGAVTVYLASTPHAGGHLIERAAKKGDHVLEYRAEGCAPKGVDFVGWLEEKVRPICIGFDGARDADGDGSIEVSVRAAGASRIRHAILSAIYVFPDAFRPESIDAIVNGSLNERCLLRIDVGSTPEQGPTNQSYDRTDLPVAQLLLSYEVPVAARETKTWWLRVPPIHRREPVSMGYIAHAFRDVLPGEAVPPFPEEKLRALAALDPLAAEKAFFEFWAAWLRPAARFDLPDPVLARLFQSRLATRAILDVNLSRGLSYNACSPFFYFDHAYRDHAYVVHAFDLAGLHDEAERLLEVYCRDAKDVPPGPIAFDGKPLQLGMLESGLWNTRPGQWDTQGQNIWALVEHYKLTGDRRWLEGTAYPYVRRGAMWLVGSRQRNKARYPVLSDPRHGLLEPGAMEVLDVGQGTHMYYLNAFAVLGLREAADAAAALGIEADARLFAEGALDLKACLGRSFESTFRRDGLYEGHLHFGVEPEGVGMYGYWAHNCLLWPCRAIDPHDPKLTATLRRMESMSDRWGGGLHSEGAGSFWPYIGVDRAIGSILRREPDRALEYFCAFTDTAGGTLSWGEGYSGRTAGGDQPHMWADAQWIHLFRSLFAFEDGRTLWITPALFRRWHAGERPVVVSGLPTHFGDLDLTIRPRPDGGRIEYGIRISPRGDQGRRAPERIVLFPRIAGGRSIRKVIAGGKEVTAFTRDSVIVAGPRGGEEMSIAVEAGEW